MNVIGIDTNILVDYFFKRERFGLAKRIIDDTVAGRQVLFISLPVYLELSWILISYYKLPKRVIINQLEAVLEIPNCEIDDREYLIKALQLYKQYQGVGFYDCLILVISKEAKVDDLASNDRRLIKIYRSLK